MNKLNFIVYFLMFYSIVVFANDDDLKIEDIKSIEIDLSQLSQDEIDSLNLEEFPNVTVVEKTESNGLTFTVPETLIQQVEQGNAEVAYFIAEMFRTGNDEYSSNKQKYQEWIKKAANMGLPQAVLDYADLLSVEDEEKALQWYEKAAEMGMSEALYSIGTFHNLGQAGLAKDCHRAYEFYEKAQMKELKVAFNDHAWYLATSEDEECRSPERAVRVFYKLKALYKSERTLIPWHVWDTEAAVLAGISDFSKAIKLQEWLIEEMQKNDYETKGYEERLEIYKNRQTYADYQKQNQQDLALLEDSEKKE